MGYFFITWAYRLLDISALQPITFLGIVWAALMDVAVWGKTSDIWTFVGAAIIVAATSYIAHREARAGGKKNMTDRLAGKVALITGGASGLGANAADADGAGRRQVVVADIAADRGKAVADKLGSAGHFVKLDVTRRTTGRPRSPRPSTSSAPSTCC